MRRADFVNGMSGLPVQAMGLNCSLGPDMAVPIIGQFHNYTALPLIFKPDAGKPELINANTAV